MRSMILAGWNSGPYRRGCETYVLPMYCIYPHCTLQMDVVCFVADFFHWIMLRSVCWNGGVFSACTVWGHWFHVCQFCVAQIRIEDLWIPYFCVTTNVSQAGALETSFLARALKVKLLFLFKMLYMLLMHMMCNPPFNGTTGLVPIVVDCTV